MATLSTGERVLSRARSLMANKGYGWSQAIELAAATLGPTPEPAPAPPVQLPASQSPGLDAVPSCQAQTIAADLASQPARARADTSARVRSILVDELRRRRSGIQWQPSALWQARESYGITLADIEAAAQE